MNSGLKTITQAVVLLVAGSIAGAQQPAPPSPAQDHIAALKTSMAASQAVLRQYQWIETVVVSVNGEQKSAQEFSCYYGADGKVAKVPLTQPPPEQQSRGLRGRIKAEAKKEMTDYMKEAVALIKQYIPPNSAKIQLAKEAGNVSFQPQPGNRVRITIANYVKPGDSLAIDVDLATNHPVQAKVTSTMDSDQEPVTATVNFGTLQNNAVYATDTVLNCQGKNLKVEIENTGYRPMAAP